MNKMVATEEHMLEFIDVYERTVDTVYKVCFLYLKTQFDAEDITQSTYLRLMTANKKFKDEEHIKAWLIVCASNLCKNILRNKWRLNTSLEEHNAVYEDIVQDEILSKILSLKPRYKDVIYLYYYEGYKTTEIANITGRRESTVRSQLARARKILKNNLGGEHYNE